MNLKEQLVTRAEEVEELKRLQAEQQRIEAKRIMDAKMAEGRTAGESAIHSFVNKAKTAADNGERGYCEVIGTSELHEQLNWFDRGYVQAIVDFFLSEDIGAYYSHARAVGDDGEYNGKLAWSLNIYW